MSDDRQEKVTQPMVEVLLDRLQSLESRLEAKLMQTSEVTAARLDRLEQLIEALRAEMNENFSRVHDAMSILNDDLLKTRAGQRELRRRVDVLESKVS